MSLFENIDLIDDAPRVAARKALALSQRRCELSFGSFLKSAKSFQDVEARLAYLDEDLKRVVIATCREVGCPREEDVYETILSSMNRFADICEDCDGEGCKHCHDTGKTSARLARRPKMCPFHREVTDISLASGNPEAGFNAMSTQAFGDSSCRGGFAGNCNWKPEMVTQSYWDGKNKEVTEQRELRDLESQSVSVDDFNQDDSWDDSSMGEEGHDIDGELAEAPSAIASPEMAIAHISAGHKPGCECGFCKNKGKLPGKDKTEPDPTQTDEDSEEKEEADDFEPNNNKNGSVHYAEALETIKLVERSGPSPKMDKKKWTPENLHFLDDVNSKDGPHPSETQDITQGTDYKGDAFTDDHRFEHTDAVLEKQKLPTSTTFGDAGFNTDKMKDSGPTKTWSGDSGDGITQANPVTKTKQTSVRSAAYVERPIVHGGSLEPLRMISQKKPGLTFDGMPYESYAQQAQQYPVGSHPAVEVGHPNPKWENVAAQVLSTGGPGPLREALRPSQPQMQPEMAPQPEMQPVASLHAGFPSSVDIQRAIEDYKN